VHITRRDFLRAAAATGLGTLVATGAAATGVSAPLIGARVKDIPWSRAATEIGPIQVTRLFYTVLPALFTRGGIPEGVRLIVSYKQPSAHTASYVESIPPGSDVQMAFHHEPEGPTDYPGAPAVAGPRFVAAFQTEQAAIAAANPTVPVAFIGGGYQYTGGKSSSRGIGGHFIPPTAHYFYLDTYQPTTIVPAAESPSIVNFLAELRAKGARFNGFAEYGRGQSTATMPIPESTVQARIQVFGLDDAWLRSLPDVRIWCYWYTIGSSGDQWRMADTASQAAWARIAAR